MVAQLRPWALTLLVITQEAQQLGYEGSAGVDQQFLERAGGRKPVRGLESFREQIALMSELPAEDQERMLEETLRSSSVFSNQAGEGIEALLDAWERGDEAALAALIFGASGEPERHAALHERIFHARNRRMAEAIARDLARGGTRFCVVGAGHLVGSRSIVALLRERGFAVERPPATPGAARELRGGPAAPRQDAAR